MKRLWGVTPVTNYLSHVGGGKIVGVTGEAVKFGKINGSYKSRDDLQVFAARRSVRRVLIMILYYSLQKTLYVCDTKSKSLEST